MQDNQSWYSTILYNLAWLLCSFLLIVDALAIREATQDVLTVVQASRIENLDSTTAGDKTKARLDASDTISFVDQVMLFGGGIVTVVLALVIEYYFRMGQQKGKLMQRIGRVVGSQVAVFIVCVLIQTLIPLAI